MPDDLDAKSVEQQNEVNSIRELMLAGVRNSPRANAMPARETALAAITIAAEAYSTQPKEAVRMELHNMVEFVMQRVMIVADTDIN